MIQPLLVTMSVPCVGDGKIKVKVRIPASDSKTKPKFRPKASPKPGSKSRSRSTQAPPGVARGTYTITFGDIAENGIRMEQIGTNTERGITVAELEAAAIAFKDKGADIELIDITQAVTSDELEEIRSTTTIKKPKLPKTMNDKSVEAKLLIVRNGADIILGDGGADKLLNEQVRIAYDRQKIWYGKITNSLARHNVCFADYDQEMNLEEKKGTVVDFKHLEGLSAFRAALSEYIPILEEVDLKGEGNHYYDTGKCGIGWHGDKERKIVIAVRLGESMSLHYHWYHNSKQVGTRVDVLLNHGDVYFMSEKAVGTDAGFKSKLTLRHGAGCFTGKGH